MKVINTRIKSPIELRLFCPFNPVNLLDTRIKKEKHSFIATNWKERRVLDASDWSKKALAAGI